MGNRSLKVSIDKKVRRILYVAYPLLPVTNESCGGAEQMLSVVESEMAARGHFTTVAACAGSQVSGVLFATGRECAEPDHFTERDAEHQARLLDLLQRTTGSQPTFDLVHDKSGSFWRRAAECNTPVLSTLHLPRHFYPGESFRNLPPNLYFNCVSDAQSNSFANIKNVVSVVRNGIQVSDFPFKPEKDDYLLWMGRVCEEKGPHLAIEVAQRTGLPLVLAGQVYPFTYHQLFYNAKIRPHLGGEKSADLFCRNTHPGNENTPIEQRARSAGAEPGRRDVVAGGDGGDGVRDTGHCFPPRSDSRSSGGPVDRIDRGRC